MVTLAVRGYWIMLVPKINQQYVYSDYLLWEDGERWELLDGIPYLQAAPSRVHQEISMDLATQFHNYLKDKSCKVFAAPFCVRLDGEKDDDHVKNVVEPDLSVICDQDKLDDRGCKGAPELIIEILSPSTGKQDKLIKFNKYENAGVQEYWIVEPEQKLVSVFILQENKRYGRPEIYAEEDLMPVHIFTDLRIDLKSVFR